MSDPKPTAEGEETPCPDSPDGQHCEHWYDDDHCPCCYCDDE